MKTLKPFLAACISTVLTLVFSSSDLSAAVTFWDDFDGNTLDLTRWSYQERDWPIGQTWFRGAPTISDGIATFEHHTYNPFDPGNSCLGQEIYSNTAFVRGPGLQVEARVRIRSAIPNGLVASFFGYMDKAMPYGNPVWSDEIDFEFLSNQINNPPESYGHRVLAVSWNDFGEPGSGYNDGVHHWEANPVAAALDLSEFNTFKIRWLADSVEWYWDPDQVRGQNLHPDVLLYRSTYAVPDEPLTLRFNFWASTSGWPLAWDSLMQPALGPDGDIVAYYDVDYVTTTQIPAPAGLVLVVLGLASIRFSRTLRR